MLKIFVKTYVRTRQLTKPYKSHQLLKDVSTLVNINSKCIENENQTENNKIRIHCSLFLHHHKKQQEIARTYISECMYVCVCVTYDEELEQKTGSSNHTKSKKTNKH